jgi:hypothetical protein
LIKERFSVYLEFDIAEQKSNWVNHLRCTEVCDLGGKKRL